MNRHFSFLTTIVLLVTACTSAAPSTPSATATVAASAQPRSGGTLVMSHIQGIAPAFDTIPANLVSQIGRVLAQANLYDTLYDLTPTGIQDGLAEKTEISADGLTWKLTLRSGVKFTDGTDFDAAAVKTNLDLRQKSAAFPLKGQMAAIRDVSVTDPRTVTLTLTSPYASLRTILANPLFGMQGPDAMAKYPAGEYYKHAIGTGPFKLEGTPNDSLSVLVRNDSYWRKKAYLDRVEIRTIPDPQSAIAAFEAGDIQVTEIPASELSRIKATAKYDFLLDPGAPYYIFFNVAKPPFNDLRVRQAVAYGVNSAPWVLLGSEVGAAADGLMNPASFGFAKQERYGYDLAKAKALLAEAGIQPGKELSLINSNINPAHVNGTQLLQRDLEALGFKASIRSTEVNAWTATITAAAPASNWNASFATASIPYPDAEAFFYRFLYSSADAPKGSNFGHYINPALDKLVDDQRKIVDPIARARALADIQKLAWTELPIYPMITIGVTYANPKTVHGLEFYPGSRVPVFSKTWTEK